MQPVYFSNEQQNLPRAVQINEMHLKENLYIHGDYVGSLRFWVAVIWLNLTAQAERRIYPERGCFCHLIRPTRMMCVRHTNHYFMLGPDYSGIKLQIYAVLLSFWFLFLCMLCDGAVVCFSQPK